MLWKEKLSSTGHYNTSYSFYFNMFHPPGLVNGFADNVNSRGEVYFIWVGSGKKPSY
jgi:hypothetical protein